MQSFVQLRHHCFGNLPILLWSFIRNQMVRPSALHMQNYKNPDFIPYASNQARICRMLTQRIFLFVPNQTWKAPLVELFHKLRTKCYLTPLTRFFNALRLAGFDLPGFAFAFTRAASPQSPSRS